MAARKKGSVKLMACPDMAGLGWAVMADLMKSNVAEQGNNDDMIEEMRDDIDGGFLFWVEGFLDQNYFINLL